MPREPKPKAAPEVSAEIRSVLREVANAGAPFIYFEHVRATNSLPGILRITLEASRDIPVENGMVQTDSVVVAHLRMNILAARNLAAVLNALLLGEEQAAAAKLN